MPLLIVFRYNMLYIYGCPIINNINVPSSDNSDTSNIRPSISNHIHMTTTTYSHTRKDHRIHYFNKIHI